MDLVKSFAIGSSAFVTLPRLIGNTYVPKEVRNYSYKEYSIVAPLYFGFMAVVANILRTQSNITLLTSIIIVYIIGSIATFPIIRFIPLYNFTPEKWRLYMIKSSIFINAFTFGTIFLLEKYLAKV